MNKKHRLVFGPIALGLCALAPREALAQYDAFLKISGVLGESYDSKHKNEIDITAFSQDVPSPGNGMPTFKFSMLQNKASPTLYSYCAGSSNVPSMLLTLRKPGADQLEFLKITLQDSTITNIHTSGVTSGADARPVDEFAVTFQAITWSYRAGIMDTPIVITWTNSPAGH